MLQSLVEAAAWLVRLTEDFRHSVIVLRDARNVKYGNFMAPGKSMVIVAEWAEAKADSPEISFKGKGEMDGSSTVSAKFTLRRYNLRDRNPALENIDRRIVEHLRQTLLVLKGDL